MKRLTLNLKSKKKILFLAISISVVYGLLNLYIHDFAARTSISDALIYEPMKVFYSYHSVFSMTFVFLPIFLIFICSNMKSEHSMLEIVRYNSIDKYTIDILKSCLFNTLIYELILSIPQITISLFSFTKIKWEIVIFKEINTILGLFFFSMLAELISILLQSKPTISFVVAAIFIMIDYFLYCIWGKSIYIVPLVSYTSDLSLLHIFFETAYGITVSIVLFIILNTILGKKSFYHNCDG